MEELVARGNSREVHVEAAMVEDPNPVGVRERLGAPPES
jgi:hypothetical protein